MSLLARVEPGGDTGTGAGLSAALDGSVEVVTPSVIRDEVGLSCPTIFVLASGPKATGGSSTKWAGG